MTLLLLTVLAAGLPTAPPAATVDLATEAGAKLVRGEWRYADARVVETEFRGPGADRQPTGPPVKTYDIQPHAGGVEFDDAAWRKLAANTLDERRGNGRVSFNWYRFAITVPEHVNGVSVSGSTAVFETSVDDYAEIWVDGELTRAAGQSGGSVVAGWNAANRLVVGRNVQPGQKIQLAIFGMNGPISNPPTNFIYLRYAKLSFHPEPKGPVAITPAEVNVTVIRKDPRFDAIIGPNLKIHKLAEGFQFTEGPVWVRNGGYLLFSDPNANTIYRYDGALSVFRTPSGYSGADIADYKQPGSNGLTLDRDGRLTINEHGNRRVTRLEKDGSLTVLAEAYEGKRLNSPNDLVYRSDGALFFTDPPFGLPKFGGDPRKELAVNGVYSLHQGKLRLVSGDFRGPNGIAFSPDEKFLYVANWDDKAKVIRRYPVRADATLGPGELFFDMTSAAGEDALDGMKVDTQGNLYVSGPGGLWVIAADGTHLGTIIPPKHPHNFAWADDGRTLYLCAREALYKMRLNTTGIRP